MSFITPKQPFTQPMAEINTTPLVDVMLVLLVIFIITAPLLQWRAVPVDLPSTQSPALQNNAAAITVSLRENGELFVGEKAVTLAELPTVLAGQVQKAGQAIPELQLHADKGTRYEKITEVMAIAQAQGLGKIAFVTEAPTATQSSVALPPAETGKP